MYKKGDLVIFGDKHKLYLVLEDGLSDIGMIEVKDLNTHKGLQINPQGVKRFWLQKGDTFMFNFDKVNMFEITQVDVQRSIYDGELEIAIFCRNLTSDVDGFIQRYTENFLRNKIEFIDIGYDT